MLNPLLAKFDGKPFMVSPEMKGVFESCLEQASEQLNRINASTEKPKMLDGDDFWFADDDWRSMFRPYNVKDGILQIPVKGVLLHDFPYQIGSWATGYDYIQKAFERGSDDSNVKGIAFVIDSPGGEVAGNFDLVDRLYEMKGEKPVRSYAAESAYSAAYSIASLADTITVSRTGGVGSIGVITAHMDVSEAMSERGIKITFIHFGKHKADGNPYNPLPDDVKERIQARIDELGQVFVSTVARNRGMDEQAVRDTEALTFTASQAVSNGLADDVGALDDAIAAFAADLSLEDEDETMAEDEKKAAVQAAQQEAADNAHAKGVTEGANAERARITAILTSDEAASRPKTALKMSTGDKFASLDADTIVEMLADMPEEKAEEPASTDQADADAPKGKSQDFAAAMENSGNPGIGQPTARSEDEKRRDRRRAAAESAGRLKAAD